MKKFLLLIILIISCLFLYAKYFETNVLKVNEYSVYHPLIPSYFDGFKIAHFSDVLYSGNEDQLNKLKNEINISNVHIIIFTGDLIKAKLNDNETQKLVAFLSSLNASEAKLAILGDNDNLESAALLESSGFEIIDNKNKLIYFGGNTPIQIGKNDSENNPYYKIGLIHKPDEYVNVKNEYNLVLAGHSLGGEIRIPFWGALFKINGAQSYTDSHYTSENGEMYVSNGLGHSKVNIRLFNAPSINIYRLYNK